MVPLLELKEFYSTDACQSQFFEHRYSHILDSREAPSIFTARSFFMSKHVSTTHTDHLAGSQGLINNCIQLTAWRMHALKQEMAMILSPNGMRDLPILWYVSSSPGNELDRLSVPRRQQSNRGPLHALLAFVHPL